jgi:hypothetical protein
MSVNSEYSRGCSSFQSILGFAAISAPAVVSAFTSTIFDALVVEPLLPTTPSSDNQNFRVATRTAIWGTTFLLTSRLARKLLKLNKPPVKVNELPERISTEEVNTILQESGMVRFYPPKKPIQSYPPDPKKSIEWVSSHPPELKELASKIMDSVEHISHEEFEKALLSSVESFNRHLASLPKNQREYTIVLPDSCPRPFKPYTEMSNLWITMLALPFLRFPPTKIAVAQMMTGKPLKDVKTKNIVLFDDASYSGSQISEIMGGMHPDRSTRIHIVTPFMTSRASTKIREELKGLVWIANYREIPMLCNLLDQNQIEKIKSAFLQPHPETLAMTYFDHKIADSWSVISSVLEEGSLLNVYFKNSLQNAPKVPFIPKISSPYKSSSQ